MESVWPDIYNISSFATIEICPIAWKCSQGKLRIWANTKWTIEKLPKTSKYCQRGIISQILSHWWNCEKVAIESSHSNDNDATKFRKFYSGKLAFFFGSGCGSVGRAVRFNTRDPQFESSHRQILFSINNTRTHYIGKRWNKETTCF